MSSKVGDHEFRYQVPESRFLFEIYTAIYNKTNGVAVRLESETLKDDYVFTKSGESGKFIWVYMDIGQDNIRYKNDGMMHVTFDPVADLCRPAYPFIKYGQNKSLTYQVHIRYSSASNIKSGNRLYAILFKIGDIDIPVAFHSSHIDKSVAPFVLRWEKPAKKDAAVAASTVHPPKKRTERSEDEVFASALVPSPQVGRKSPPKKSRPDSPDYPMSSDLEELPMEKEIVADSLTFDERATELAMKHLVNKPEFIKKAIDEVRKLVEPHVRLELEKKLQAQIYEELKMAEIEKIKGDPRRKAQFWKEARATIVSQLIVEEGPALRLKAIEKLYDEEKERRRENALRTKKDLAELNALPINPKTPNDPATQAAVSQAVDDYLKNN